MLLTKEVEVNLISQNIPYYEKLGYTIPRRKNKYGRLGVPLGTKLMVNIKDLPLGIGGANYANQDGDWVERKDAVYMKRWYRGSRSKWIKKLCNRKFRRKGVVSSNRAIQHKMTEYWWIYI